MERVRNGLAKFVVRHFGATRASVRLYVEPFRGGLESVQVAHIHAEYRDRHNQPRGADFVMKVAERQRERESAAYRLLLPQDAGALAPKLLGIEAAQAGRVHLYLEWIKPWRPWPWRDAELIAKATERLAAVHATFSPLWFQYPHSLSRWNYENELSASAISTLESFEGERIREEAAPFRRSLPALRRLVKNLPALRRQLRLVGMSSVVLHGDAHSGNVIVRVRDGRYEPVLLDWGRTRIGSPWEDVSSWLQSLGFWEPEARRLHDTLVCRYLAARGLQPKFLRCLREQYWIAAACNGLAGALRYHLLSFLDRNRPKGSRISAQAALLDWLRVVRRADAVCRA